MTPSTFAEILEDCLNRVEAAVALIENGEGDTPELDNLRGHLIDILDIIERKPGIEAARIISTRLPPPLPEALVSVRPC